VNWVSGGVLERWADEVFRDITGLVVVGDSDRTTLLENAVGVDAACSETEEGDLMGALEGPSRTKPDWRYAK
jgi:hypothetical protein